MPRPGYNQEYYQRNRKRLIARSQENYQSNRGHKISQATRWNRANPERRRAILLKHKYGLTTEQYQMLFTTQNGACAICRKEFGRDVRPFVDHDHKTGRVRALLCVRCNTWMAPIDSDLLDALLAYKKKYSE